MHPRTILTLVFTLFLASRPDVAADEAPSKFPELGKDYSLSFVAPIVKSDSADPFSRSGRLVVFTRHIRGDWYEVAFLLGGGISKTYLNLAHVVTITETDRKSVSEQLKRSSKD